MKRRQQKSEQDATFQPCCTLPIQVRAAPEEFREATVLSQPSAVPLFAAQHSGNCNPRATNPILAVAVLMGHGPMSDGCAALVCDASRSIRFAADRARTRSAKPNRALWSAGRGLHESGGCTRWLVRTDAHSYSNLADGPLFKQFTRHLTILTRRESAGGHVLLREKA
jgi:hypothetical protein